MGLLDLLVGADAARQFRERMMAAQATAEAGAARAAAGGPAGTVLPAGGATAARRAPRSTAAAAPRTASASPAANVAGAPIAATATRSPALADPLGLAGFGAGDFPTSILATAEQSTPPLLSAFANRPALLAAIVFSEALAPPVALR